MTCICCNNSQTKEKFVKDDYHIFECDSCGFQFVHPLPSLDDLSDHYNTALVTDELKDKIKSSLDDLHNNPNNPKRDWFDNILSLSQDQVKKDSVKVLEIGSAYGYFIDYCNSKGHEAIGVEVTKEYAQASVGMIRGEVISIQESEYRSYFADQTFDLIYLEHVFEHVLKPKVLLNELKHLLSPNGIIVITVPNHRSFLSLLRGKNYKWTCPPSHLYFHNKESIRSLAENSELEEIKSFTGDYYHRSIYQFYSFDSVRWFAIRVLNKLFKLQIRFSHSYQYPRKITDILSLFPYLIFSPLLNFMNKRKGMGNELTTVLGKRSLVK